MLATALLLATAGASQAATLTVNSSADPGDGTCDVVACTLREAITEADADVTPDMDEIVFSAAMTISPSSVLPAFDEPVTLNGMTGSGCTGSREGIALDGGGQSFAGLRLLAGATGSRICGLNVRGFVDGIRVGAANSLIEGNLVGTDGTGETADGNSQAGVHVLGAGDSTTVFANVLSGNTRGLEIDAAAAGIIVTANLVGTDDDGEQDVGNTEDGVLVQEGAGVTMGGDAPARNVVSGNDMAGIAAGAGTYEGNYIGTDADGTDPLPNNVGVDVEGPGVEVGGPTAGERNVISGNAEVNVSIDDAATVEGNWIGPAGDGTSLGPGLFGVVVNAANATVRGNVISDHVNDGVLATVGGGLVVEGNVIGLAPDGVTPMSNGEGIDVGDLVASATVEDNLVAENGAGISTDSLAAQIAGNTIRDNAAGDGVSVGLGVAEIVGNSIARNGDQAGHLGIDLAPDGLTPNDDGDGDSGPNGRQNSPVLTKAETGGGATDVAGTIDTTPGHRITIEVFANASCDTSGAGEGETFLGRAEVTAGSGATPFAFTVGGTTAGQQITATATDEDVGVGQTSEFSACFTATQEPDPPPDPPAPPPEEPPAAPFVPPPPPPPLLTFPLPPVPKFPAKVAVLRNGVDDGVLDMLIQITSRSETPGAELELDYESSGRHTRFDVPIEGTQIKVRKKLPKSQPKDTGIVEIEYDGNDAVSPDAVRLRAADGKSLLKRSRSEIEDGKLEVEGTIDRDAEGVVRIRLEYSLPDGSTDFLYWNARISNGKWSISKTLPPLAAGGGQLSIQFTGYEKENLRGEQIAKQVLATR